MDLFDTFKKLNTKLTNRGHRKAVLSLEKVMLEVLAQLLHHDERFLIHSFEIKFATSVNFWKL